MCVNVLDGCVYVHHVCTWCPHRSEEGIRALELELQTVLSCYVAAGIRAQVLFKSSK